MAASTWKGFLSFGLISIPIRLSPAARTERISFNQLHKVCHTRLKQPLFCPTCNRMVERNEVEKGYEYEKDQYLLFTEEELEKIEPESARTMEILEFVKVDEIDPLYFDASYYVAPEEAGARAYHLLLEAMKKSGYAGIAKVTMHSREYIVIIRAGRNGLTLHTMFYSNEIRSGGGVWEHRQNGAEGARAHHGDAADRKSCGAVPAGEISRHVSGRLEDADRGEGRRAGCGRAAAHQPAAGGRSDGGAEAEPQRNEEARRARRSRCCAWCRRAEKRWRRRKKPPRSRGAKRASSFRLRAGLNPAFFA